MTGAPLLSVAAVVAVCAVALVGLALVRRRHARQRAYRSGPGGAVALAGRTEEASPWRGFTLALAAPYTRLAGGPGRASGAEPDWSGWSVPGGESGVRRVRAALRRDWGVRNRTTAKDALDALDDRSRGHLLELVALRQLLQRDLVAHLGACGLSDDVVRRVVATLAPREGDPPTVGLPDAGLVALDLARGANLARWCGAVPLVSRGRAERSLDLVGALAVLGFAGWPDLADHYRAGLAAAGAARAQEFAAAADWLAADTASPWRRQPWPQASQPIAG